MAVLDQLEPKKVFQFFEEMCAIPHGSGNTKAVSDWCADFAKKRSLEYHQDASNNIIIIKEASYGYENAEPVILQGHLDMVCEKAPECAKDMAKEGLDLVVDGDLILARGTTLGGDDGIAVALAMAILDADDLAHPRVEAVFTVDEEIGMLGADVLDVSPLKGKRFLNLDSEAEGIFTVSCAGGNMTKCTIPVQRSAFVGSALTVTVSGLIGSHSGQEINKGRGNSSLLMGRVLLAMSQATELRLVAVDGGLKDNAIPRETTATVLAADEEKASAAAALLGEALKNEYHVTDRDVTLTVTSAKADQAPMDADSTRRCVCFLNCAPNGIQAMSADIPGLVQTSLNLGVLTTQENAMTASFCVRSSVGSQKAMLKARLNCLTAMLGGKTEVSGEYDAWEYRAESPLRDLMVEVFKDQYGKEPKIEAIHAGVECGLFCGKLPELDCVSIGPDLKDIHTPRERLSISSTRRLWGFVTEVLRRAK
ncbi:aminoacyl-histidine dipeptidase [Oscillibacter sp.]|uniref:aminoacyl-histidine dipeptidase n=1 Tax=Oscillibacter sp. TaxID=1945593 RepID=UPI0028A16828|nr:aminoacyl-histidine dipeptidase [Oscillibacter sp.]